VSLKNTYGSRVVFMNGLIGSLKCTSLEFKVRNESAPVATDSNARNKIASWDLLEERDLLFKTTLKEIIVFKLLAFKTMWKI
jgi:hypothetical protein